MYINIFFSLYLFIFSIYDILNHKLPNVVLIGLLTTITSLKISFCFNSILLDFFSALFFLVLFILIYMVSNGLGFGDVKLISVCAFSIGFFNTLFSIFFASLLGISYSLILIKDNKHLQIPFAPFITMGYLSWSFVNHFLRII